METGESTSFWKLSSRELNELNLATQSRWAQALRAQPVTPAADPALTRDWGIDCDRLTPKHTSRAGEERTSFEFDAETVRLPAAQPDPHLLPPCPLHLRASVLRGRGHCPAHRYGGKAEEPDKACPGWGRKEETRKKQRQCKKLTHFSKLHNFLSNKGKFVKTSSNIIFHSMKVKLFIIKS